MSTLKTVKRIPHRMCAACRTMKPKGELIRVVKSPDGTVSVDTSNKAPGRGAYICRNSECPEKAIKTKVLPKMLKTAVPEDVQKALLNILE